MESFEVLWKRSAEHDIRKIDHKFIPKILPEFIRFLYIAKGSAGELRTQIYIANQIGYIEETKFFELKSKVEQISRMIGNLIKSLKKVK